jgi:hypothetical protein
MRVLAAGGREGYCDIRIRRMFFNYRMDLPAALVELKWDLWSIGAPQNGLGYHLVRRVSFFFLFSFL